MTRHIESKEYTYISQPFEQEVVTIEATGEIIIKIKDETGIFGNIPLKGIVPSGVRESGLAIAREEMTLQLAEAMEWKVRRLLSRRFEVGDKSLEFMYLLDNAKLKKEIEKDNFVPVFLQDLNTSDLA